MKIHHIVIALASLAATACSSTNTDPVSIDEAKNFEDSASIAVGNRLGLVALYDLEQNVTESIDKEEMWRGVMTVMNADSANISYIYGIATGELLMRNYIILGSRTKVDKELYLRAARTAFMRSELPSDSVLQEAIRMYNLVYERIEANERAVADAKAFDTQEAVQNRMLNEAVEAELKANPAYQPLGHTSILANVAVAGDGVAFVPGQYSVMDITLNRIATGEKIVSRQNVMLPVDKCPDALVASLMPYLSVGETATFYVPYQYAYGVQGLPGAGIGPCESIMATITVKEVK